MIVVIANKGSDRCFQVAGRLVGKQRYFYAGGDALFEVRKADEAIAAEVIGGLE